MWSRLLHVCDNLSQKTTQLLSLDVRGICSSGTYANCEKKLIEAWQHWQRFTSFPIFDQSVQWKSSSPAMHGSFICRFTEKKRTKSFLSSWPRQTKRRIFLQKSYSNKVIYIYVYNQFSRVAYSAYEWQRGCRLYGHRWFYHVNCVVVMLTSLHLHKKSKELCIKTKSPAASLPFIGRVTEPQL